MFFEELHDGATYRTPSHTVTAEELDAFARQFDPQPMHLDAEASAKLSFGDVITSGFHTLALAWRLWVEIGLEEHGRGGIALGDVRWHRPVYAGTEVCAVVHIEGPRVTSQGKGLATMRFEVLDGYDQLLMTFATTGLFARRSEGSPTTP